MPGQVQNLTDVGLLTETYNTYTVLIQGEYRMATKTLNIAIDEQLLKEIDQAVKQDLGSRSEYFRRLALADLNRRNRWDELFSSGKQVGKQMDITSEEQVYKIIKE